MPPYKTLIPCASVSFSFEVLFIRTILAVETTEANIQNLPFVTLKCLQHDQLYHLRIFTPTGQPQENRRASYVGNSQALSLHTTISTSSMCA